MPGPGLIVLDFDGTIADTSEDLVIAINHIRSSRGLSLLSTESAIALVGRGAHRLISDAIELPMEHPDTMEALEKFREYYGAHQADHVCLYPTVMDTLKKLSPRFRLAVLSNKPGAMVRTLAEFLEVDGLLEVLWGSDDVSNLKPDPSGLRALMRMYDSHPAATVMVGDQPIDIMTGRNAGTHTVFCSYGFWKGRSLELSPEHVIHQMGDLVGIVEGMSLPSCS